MIRHCDFNYFFGIRAPKQHYRKGKKMNKQLFDHKVIEALIRFYRNLGGKVSKKGEETKLTAYRAKTLVIRETLMGSGHKTAFTIEVFDRLTNSSLGLMTNGDFACAALV